MRIGGVDQGNPPGVPRNLDGQIVETIWRLHYPAMTRELQQSEGFGLWYFTHKPCLVQ